MADISAKKPIINDDLDGQITVGIPSGVMGSMEDMNQLDEPIMDTLMRDLSVILRGWDLWGPLLLCIFLSFNLHHSESRDNHAGPHFANVFVLVWFGSCIVSLNYRLLSISSATSLVESSTMNPNQPQHSKTGLINTSMEDRSQMMTAAPYEKTFTTLLSPPSLFQLICVFGYCLVAPCIGLILLKIFSFDTLLFERIIVGLLFGFAWPTFCSIRILIRYQHPSKRALAIYPIGLFYFVLSCMIILNH